MIGIINYGMGNLASVKNAFDYLGIQSVIIDTPENVKRVDKLVLPGVGAFGMAMKNLNDSGFSDAIKEDVLINKKQILGICLGMQLLLETSSEHGDHEGLAMINGKVSFFGEKVSNEPIPHMGWNDVMYNSDSILYKGVQPSPSFYFVHSYYCCVDDPLQVSGISSYGIDFHSSIESENIFGCQFHPEKSQQNGLAIFKNYHSI